jgi:hypothetical protein
MKIPNPYLVGVTCRNGTDMLAVFAGKVDNSNQVFKGAGVDEVIGLASGVIGPIMPCVVAVRLKG